MADVRLLHADKDEAARHAVRLLSEEAGYIYEAALDGISAIKLFRRRDYHLVVTETDLPALDGWNVCRQIRKMSDVPIIFLSARTEERDKLLAFESGADDYVCKPFSPRELSARIRVFLCRASNGKSAPQSKIALSGLVIDTVSRAVYVDGNPVRLTPKEYDLLHFLSRNPNRAFSREAILNEVWGYEFTGSDRTVDTHIKMLRDNIKPYDPCIVTVWGFGYKFVV